MFLSLGGEKLSFEKVLFWSFEKNFSFCKLGSWKDLRKKKKFCQREGNIINKKL